MRLKCADCPFWYAEEGGKTGPGCHFYPLGVWDQAPCELEDEPTHETNGALAEEIGLTPRNSDRFECDFFDDAEKMFDFFKLSKDEFLASYSYLNELEYDATKLKASSIKVFDSITEEDWTNYCSLMENWDNVSTDSLYLGSIYMGLVCVDVTARQTFDERLPKFVLDFDIYLRCIDTGYGYKNEIPYDFYGGNSFSSLHIDKTKEEFVKIAAQEILPHLSIPYVPYGYNDEVYPLAMTLNETTKW